MDTLRALRNRGFKVTLPRVRVLEIFFRGHRKHVTPAEVQKILYGEGLLLNMTTVHRVLMQLVAADILRTAHIDAAVTMFELNEGDRHDHLICRCCGRVDEFVDVEIERRQRNTCSSRGFVMTAYSLSLYGTCADCLVDPPSERIIRPA